MVGAESGVTTSSDRRRKDGRGAIGRDLQRRDGFHPRLARLRGPLLAYLVVTAIFSLGNSSDAFLILRARDLEVAAALIPVLYVARIGARTAEEGIAPIERFCAGRPI